MKKSILAIAVCTIIASALLTGCNSPAQKVENAQDNVIKANEDLDKANKEYLADMEKYRIATADQIAANNKRNEEIKAIITKEKKENKAKFEKKLAELEQKNIDMKNKIDAYKDQGKENWEKFKAEFNHDMEELSKAYKDFSVKNLK